MNDREQHTVFYAVVLQQDLGIDQCHASQGLLSSVRVKESSLCVVYIG